MRGFGGGHQAVHFMRLNSNWFEARGFTSAQRIVFLLYFSGMSSLPAGPATPGGPTAEAAASSPLR
jgi:hypothetical protein